MHLRVGSRPALPLHLSAAHRARSAAPQTINDLEALWEVPAQPQRVLFVAHGCAHAGSDFWAPSPRCPHCLGLPQEQLVRAAALRRGYAVVAVSSFDRESKCWHNTQAWRSEDLRRLPAILRRVVKEEGLQGLPLYALGASSGGGIVLRLAQAMPEVQVRGRSGTSQLIGEAAHRWPPVSAAR